MRPFPCEGGTLCQSPARATRARTGSRFSCRPTEAAALSDRLLRDEPEVKPIGLGARDSLRLEAGLCPLRPRPRRRPLAGRGRSRLRRRASAAARRAAFPAPSASARELDQGPLRRRVGLSSRAGRRPAKAPRSRDADGRPIGIGHLGRFRSDRRRPDRHGLCRRPLCRGPARRSDLIVRGKALPATVVAAALRPPPLSPQTGFLRGPSA